MIAVLCLAFVLLVNGRDTSNLFHVLVGDSSAGGIAGYFLLATSARQCGGSMAGRG